jgi:hypothetical protein
MTMAADKVNVKVLVIAKEMPSAWLRFWVLKAISEYEHQANSKLPEASS